MDVPFSSVQLLSSVWLFATPWITACQASLSITNFRSSLKLMSIELVMPSSHLILCRPLLLHPNPSQHQSFPMSQLYAWGGQSTEISALASVLPMNTQDWSPLEWISSNEVDETGAYYTEWSKPERKTSIQYTNAYIWNLERW